MILVNNKLNSCVPCGRDGATAFWTISRALRELSTPLYLTLLRLYLEYKITLQTPQYRKDIDILEQGWWTATNMKRGLEYMAQERLRETVCSALRRGGLMGILS